MKEDIIRTSDRASKENDDLRIFVAAGWVHYSSIDDLTERRIQRFVDNRCKHKATGEQLYMIDLKMRNVGMKMQIFEARDRI